MFDRQKTIEELLHNLHGMRRKLMAGYSCENNLEITSRQGFVLHIVAKNKTVNVKTLAKELNVTSSAATQLIDGLVTNGYLVRENNPKDRRVSSLSLSDKAKQLFAEFKKQGLQKMTVLFSALNDEELALYAQLNQKIFTSIINEK